MIEASGEDLDEVRQAVSQTEQAAQEAQKSIGEARIFLNAKQASRLFRWGRGDIICAFGSGLGVLQRAAIGGLDICSRSGGQEDWPTRAQHVSCVCLKQRANVVLRKLSLPPLPIGSREGLRVP